MEGKGAAIMGTGRGSGKNRAIDAATSAINNPMLEDSRIDGAKFVLVNISSGDNLSLDEIDEVMGIITSSADSNALIKYGTVIDPEMIDEIAVTVIATGFNTPVTSAETGFGGKNSASDAPAQASKYMGIAEFLEVTKKDLNSVKTAAPGVSAAGKGESHKDISAPDADASQPAARERDDFQPTVYPRNNKISLRDTGSGLGMQHPLGAMSSQYELF
jgi:cell division protein FtsZ